MSNLASLPTQHPCGTRAQYVMGKCRCADCRAANARYYHARKAKALAAAADLVVVQAEAQPQLWTAPDGTQRYRLYRRACPGVHGQPCPRGAHLRKDSSAVCETCRDRLVWNGLVPAAKAQAHVRWLSKRGVGRDAVSAACDVGVTTISEIRTGRKRRIRAEVERRILGVTPDALSDHALVGGGRTWAQLHRLLDEGFTKTELARRLGSKAKVPTLQIRRRVTAATAAKVERFYAIIMAGADDRKPKAVRR